VTDQPPVDDRNPDQNIIELWPTDSAHADTCVHTYVECTLVDRIFLPQSCRPQAILHRLSLNDPFVNFDILTRHMDDFLIFTREGYVCATAKKI